MDKVTIFLDKLAAWLLSLTLTQIAVLICAAIVANLLLRRKKIMSAVRASLLTVEGWIASAVHACLILGAVAAVMIWNSRQFPVM